MCTHTGKRKSEQTGRHGNPGPAPTEAHSGIWEGETWGTGAWMGVRWQVAPPGSVLCIMAEAGPVSAVLVPPTDFDRGSHRGRGAGATRWS